MPSILVASVLDVTLSIALLNSSGIAFICGQGSEYLPALSKYLDPSPVRLNVIPSLVKVWVLSDLL